MPIPDFVRDLRAKVGTTPLWLSGASAVVLDGARILLIRRSDDGQWTPITGIIDPGEEPAVTLVREALEEANVDIEVERLTSTWVTRQVVYDNGDQAQYLDLTFRCRYVGGDPRPVDGEASEVAWFPLDGMPTMSPEMTARVRYAIGNEGPAYFARGPLGW
ncbi:NUDIX hydrolase [Pseudolysinimonas sp.]|jgi:8-oxo-dGTP pyrophosphatase MutT (NUDIX family)|uniref:NUDIX hydrolase n=1 Tax=Pseudolysinimonas sp. TaxID=2680009 RepID=UPI003783A082